MSALRPLKLTAIRSAWSQPSKSFDERCRVYQYLFKRNHETIPYQTYQNPVVNSAIESRVAFLKSKAENLYALKIYYVLA